MAEEEFDPSVLCGEFPPPPPHALALGSSILASLPLPLPNPLPPLCAPDHNAAPPENYALGVGIFEDYSRFSQNPYLPTPPSLDLESDVSVPVLATALKTSTLNILKQFTVILGNNIEELNSIANTHDTTDGGTVDSYNGTSEAVTLFGTQVEALYEDVNRLRVVQSVASVKEKLEERKEDMGGKLERLRGEIERAERVLKDLESAM